MKNVIISFQTIDIILVIWTYIVNIHTLKYKKGYFISMTQI